jgi:hypothetical protein
MDFFKIEKRSEVEEFCIFMYSISGFKKTAISEKNNPNSILSIGIN